MSRLSCPTAWARARQGEGAGEQEQDVVPSHPISSHLTPSHALLSHLISRHPTPFHPFQVKYSIITQCLLWRAGDLVSTSFAIFVFSSSCSLGDRQTSLQRGLSGDLFPNSNHCPLGGCSPAPNRGDGRLGAHSLPHAARKAPPSSPRNGPIVRNTTSDK